MLTPPGSSDSFASLFEKSAGARRGGQRSFSVGQQIEVVVVAVGRDAVFADLGGKQEGFFERPDLTDAEGTLHASVGSKIFAKVTSVDKETGQIRLTPVVIRSANVDTPAIQVGPKVEGAPLLVEGSRVKGKITGIERYGLFVQITGSQGRSGRGLVPMQETGTARGADLKKHFSIGQEIETKILNIDETGKIRLSIGALSADDERGLFEAYKKGEPGSAEPAPAAAEAEAPRGAPKKAAKPEPRNFGTLADLLPKITPKAAAPAPAPAEAPAAAAAPRPRAMARHLPDAGKPTR